MKPLSGFHLVTWEHIKKGALKLQDGTRKSDKLFTYLNMYQTNQQVG
jgi:hypothetical protein